jgi:hypothetical protein
MFEVNVLGFGQLQFNGNRLFEGADCRIQSNTASRHIDYLLYFDSRGISGGYEESFSRLIIEHLSSKRNSYLLIVRPHNLTTWATLAGFLRLGQIEPAQIITNMGFVDFTPKKKSIIEEALEQLQDNIGPDLAETVPVDQMRLSNGEMQTLYSLQYSNHFKVALVSHINNVRCIVINTPLIDPAITWPRHRPQSFYRGLQQTREFNQGLPVTLVDIGMADRSDSYDAVHYTASGNLRIYHSLRELI